MTLEEIKKIYCECRGIYAVDFSPEFLLFLHRIGIKIDEPEEKIEITRSRLSEMLSRYRVETTMIEISDINFQNIKNKIFSELGFPSEEK